MSNTGVGRAGGRVPGTCSPVRLTERELQVQRNTLSQNIDIS